MSKRSAFKHASQPQADYGAFSLKDNSQDYPYFSFRHVCQDQYCMQKCAYEQLKSLSDKLRVLSSLDWKHIASQPRETHGYELLPQKSIKTSLPPFVLKEEDIMVFRFGAGKRSGRIVGVKRDNKFYVLFVDRDFTLYDHGS